MNKILIRKALEESYRELLPYSSKYNHDFNRYLFSLEIIMGLDNVKGKKLLDFGTGIGLMPLALNKLGLISEGLEYYIFPDRNNEMFGISDIDNLLFLWKRLEIIVHNYSLFDESLRDKIGTFDIILSEATIEHIKDPKDFFKQCRSLLSSGGYLLVTTPNIATLIKRLRFLFGKTTNWPIKDFFIEGDNFTGHWREYTKEELKYMAFKSDFKVVKFDTKNVYINFKSFKRFRKNIRILLSLLSYPSPNMSDIHYMLCQK